MIQVVFATGCQHGSKFAFGYKNKLPWPHIPRDLANFKARTKNTVLVMSAGTFRSLPSKLPGRPHIVLSSQAEAICAKNGDRPDDVLDYTVWGNDTQGMLSNLEAIFSSHGDLSIIGGKDLILACIPYADKIIHTVIASASEFENTVSFHKDDLSFRRYSPLESHWYWLSDDWSVNQPNYITETVYANPTKRN